MKLKPLVTIAVLAAMTAGTARASDPPAGSQDTAQLTVHAPDDDRPANAANETAAGMTFAEAIATIEQMRRDHVEQLAARADARSLLVAAIVGQSLDFTGGAMSEASQAYLGEAQRLAPDDPMTWIVTWKLCGRSVSAACNHAETMRRLTTLEPENAAFLLDLIDRDGSDDAAVRRAFDAPRYDDHHLTVTRLVLDHSQTLPDRYPHLAWFWRLTGLDPAGGNEEELRQAMAPYWAITHTMGYTNPTLFRVINRFCDPQAQPAWRDQCVGLLRRVAETSTTAGGRDSAYTRLLKLTEGTDEHAHWNQLARTSRWHRAQVTEHTEAAPMSPQVRLLTQMARIGEIAAIQAYLRDHDLPQNPPDDWDPEQWKAAWSALEELRPH